MNFPLRDINDGGHLGLFEKLQIVLSVHRHLHSSLFLNFSVTFLQILHVHCKKFLSGLLPNSIECTILKGATFEIACSSSLKRAWFEKIF